MNVVAAGLSAARAARQERTIPATARAARAEHFWCMKSPAIWQKVIRYSATIAEPHELAPRCGTRVARRAHYPDRKGTGCLTRIRKNGGRFRRLMADRTPTGSRRAPTTGPA